MAPTEDFKQALQSALSAITPAEDTTDTSDCPRPEIIAGHVRGQKIDDTIAGHIQSCVTCGQFANDVKRRQRLYERQKVAFTELAEQKYRTVPVLKETFRPFAWMFNWKALVPEVAFVIVIFAVAFNFHSGSLPGAVPATSAIDSERNIAASTIRQIENSDPQKPADTALLLEKFHDQPELVGQVDATRVAQARLAINEKKATVANDTNLADQWSAIEGKLQGYELIAHYNSLRKRTEGTGMLGTVADVEGKNGIVTISFDHDPIVDSEDSKLFRTSAVETPGLNQVTILTPQRRWQLDSKDDFALAVTVDSHQTQKPQ